MEGRELYNSFATEKFKQMISFDKTKHSDKPSVNTSNQQKKRVKSNQKSSDLGVRVSADDFNNWQKFKAANQMP